MAATQYNPVGLYNGIRLSAIHEIDFVVAFFYLYVMSCVWRCDNYIG